MDTVAMNLQVHWQNVDSINKDNQGHEKPTEYSQKHTRLIFGPKS